MKGKFVAMELFMNYSLNAAQLYAFGKGWHIGGKRRKTISDPAIQFANEASSTGKGRLMRNHMQVTTASFGIQKSFTAEKGHMCKRFYGVQKRCPNGV
jgi:hypothetical protein